jgi:hypothetical protein
MSQNDKILDYLKLGKSITPLEALTSFKCFRLASRINEINNMGYNVVKDMVKDGETTYAKYYLYNK